MFVRDIGTPFVRWNGYNCAPPRLKIQCARETSLYERAQILQIIGQAIPLDADQLYEDFSLKPPTEGEGVMFPSKTIAPPKGAGGDNGNQE